MSQWRNPHLRGDDNPLPVTICIFTRMLVIFVAACYMKPMTIDTDNTNSPLPNPEELQKLATMEMPFGKFKGTRLIDLPEPYVVWFKRQGFPKGKLGSLLETLYEIKVNGLEPLVRKINR